MSLTILSASYSLAPVSMDTSGGAEQILHILDEATLRAGHRSIVIAPEPSAISGEHVSTGPLPEVLDEEAKQQAQERHRSTIDRVLREQAPDVLHLHGIDFHAYLPSTDIPIVVTLHLPIDWYPREVLENAPPNVHFVCVSKAQFDSKPDWLRVTRVIENGIRTELFEAHVTKRPYALAMGRVCEEKGLHIAMRAASAAGMFLVLGGELFAYPEHVEYFRNKIEPNLNPERNRYVGPLALERKRRLLAGASCFLQPSQAQETSSLTAMEALAAGTPVVAFNSGALPTIVEHESTGFVVNSETEMAEAITRAAIIDPEVCRRTARQRFDSRRMSEEYLELYAELAKPRPSATPKRTSFEQEWRSLWHEQSQTTPFQSPDWLTPWNEHIAAGRAEFRTFRQAGKLAGVLPLNQWEGCCRLAGEGITDYLDAIGNVELPAEPYQFVDLPSWSSLRTGQAASHDATFVINIQQSWQEYLMTLPQKLRKDIREAQGEVQQLRAPDIEILFDLHARRWKDRNEAGVLRRSQVQQFHRAVTCRFDQQGLLRLYGLRLDGRYVAAVYAFQHRDRLYFYLGGFDPEYSAISPGTVTIAAVIERALCEGVRYVDFLRGAEGYKLRWRATATPTYRISGP
ncbi:MAG TPA: GNAT family N-acetyltransferase [Bryobacteraceae bacterium]|nr:GNAT family N-acetyltransferase [Bryobacteraceae bacterium]